MTRFYRKFWNRKSQQKGLFGGKIASHQEVKALSKKITNQEAAEMAAFEAEFDKKLKDL